ncbi:MAG: transcription-repair coupling factor, partial [Gammaproteobacteria bacterium]|nr:transcription-repair coupling factor [Gammaproteobacteria bacterium]
MHPVSGGAEAPLALAPADRPVSPLNPPLPAPGATLAWEGLLGSGRGLALAQAAVRHPGPLLVITRETRGIPALEDELRFYAGDDGPPILSFPDWECLPYDAFSPHQDIVSQRLLVLHTLPTLARGLVLVSAATLSHRLPPRAYLLAHSLRLAVGERLELAEFRRQLEHAAYQAVEQVMQPGEFAVRGGLVDVYPMGS